jgi:PAS domain S-box-containing protein
MSAGNVVVVPDPRAEIAVPTAAVDTDRDDILLRAARALSGARRETIFEDLTRAVVELLDCDVGLIGVNIDHAGVPSIRTLALLAEGRFLRPMTYPLRGSPCETVVGQEFRFYARDVGYLFPDLVQENARISGYAAYPLFDRSHCPLGVITVMRYAEMENPERAESLLRIFAERAVAEIERSAAEDALRASEEQYRAIFNASVDGLLLLKPDGKVVDVNRAFENLYGFTREELLGNNVLDYLARENREAGQAFIDTVLATGYVQTEDRTRRKDGSMLYSEPRGVRMDYQGEPHVLCIVRDISQAKQRAYALRQSQDLLRATIDAGLDCIIALDQSGCVLDFNPAAERCFGYTKEAVLGRSLRELIVPEHFRPTYDAALERCLCGDEGPFLGRRMEVAAMRADGSEFPAELAIAMTTGSHGKVCIAYLRDLTERKEAENHRQVLERQLRQAQKMEALGHLTGGVAHDFNNILTSVLGYVELAMEHVRCHQDEKLDRYLARAQRSGERARDLIQQMLTFSRGQQGEPRLLQLKQVIDDGMTLLESTMPATIRMDKHFERDLPPALLDPVHVEQILVNLCINARDAMNGSGRLTVEVRRARGEGGCASCHQPIEGDYVELAVADTGPGLDEQIIERIFEPFFSTKEVGKGSGMGLATVHGIVHEYGGHIVVESRPGHGARFRVLLPAAARSATDGTAPAERARAEGSALRGRVLLVDDNIEVAEFLDELLTSWGLDVVPFADGLKARDHFLIQPHAYDLVILDQTMPNLTGLRLAGQLLEVRTDLPIILYTGYSEEVCEQAATAAGIRAFVQKPLDVPRFRALVAEILGGS